MTAMTMGTASRNPFRRRWWVRVKTAPPPVYGRPTPGTELYTPLWAWPFELLHRAAFGPSILKG